MKITAYIKTIWRKIISWMPSIKKVSVYAGCGSAVIGIIWKVIPFTVKQFQAPYKVETIERKLDSVCTDVAEIKGELRQLNRSLNGASGVVVVKDDLYPPVKSWAASPKVGKNL